MNQALDSRTDFAVSFADKVNKFLNNFGLTRDRAALTARLAEGLGEVGSRDWFLTRSQQGQHLFAAGRYAEAEAVFQEVLAGLGEGPSYERCITLNLLGRCLGSQGRPDQAAERYRQALALEAWLAASGIKEGPLFRGINRHGQLLPMRLAATA